MSSPSYFNPADEIANRHAKTTYVILLKDDKGRLSLLADPGLSRPWAAAGPNALRNKKTAEYHATQCDGMACTWEEAYRLLLKENPHFEKQLYDQLKRKAKIVESGLFHDKKTNQIVDEHGRPVDPTK